MKSFTDAIENEIDEVREGAVSENEEEIADIISQLDALLGALYDNAIDFDATWNDIYDDISIDVVYESNVQRCIVVVADNISATIVIEGGMYDFERGDDGWYDINDSQSRFTFVEV